MNVLEVVLAGPYNLLYAGGFALAFGVAAWEGRRRGWPLVSWLTLLAVCVAGGVAGSKLLHFDLHVAAPGEKTILGGLAGGILALGVAQRFLRFDGTPTTVLAPAALLGFAVGRVGCFLVGCCFGRPTELPWGVRYGAGTRAFEAQHAAGLLEASATSSLPVHPTQLFEAFFALLLAAALWRWGGRLRSAGAAGLGVVIGYGAIRFAVEFYRAGGEETVLLGLKTVQWTVGAAGLAAALVLMVREQRPRTSASQPAREVPRFVSPPPSSVARASLLVGVLLVAGVMGTLWLTPLEHAVWIAALAPAAVAMFFEAQFRWRVAPGGVVAALVLVPVGIDTVPAYPRSHFSVGASGNLGEFTSYRDLSLGDDCGPAENRYHAYRVLGLSGGYSRRTSPTDGLSARLRGFMGRDKVERLNGTPIDEEARIRGAAASVTRDFHYFGFTAGVLGGELIDRYGLPKEGIELIGGVRGGALHGFFGEIQYNDHDPAPNPDTRVKVSAGYGFGDTGSNLRLGAWDSGFFVGGRLVTRWGFEVEPFVGTPGGEETSQFGLTLRQRFGARARPLRD